MAFVQGVHQVVNVGETSGIYGLRISKGEDLGKEEGVAVMEVPGDLLLVHWRLVQEVQNILDRSLIRF